MEKENVERAKQMLKEFLAQVCCFSFLIPIVLCCFVIIY
jgi:hypothetical protein